MEEHAARMERLKRSVGVTPPSDECLTAELREQAAKLAARRVEAEELAEATSEADKAVPLGRLADAATLKAAILAGKDPAASVTDKAERSALSRLAVARSAEAGVVDVLVEEERAFERALRKNAEVLAQIAIDVAAEVGTEHAALTSQWIQSWHRRNKVVTHEADAIKFLDETKWLRIKGIKFPYQRPSPADLWIPDGRDRLRMPFGNAIDGATLETALKADARRHIPPTPKPTDTTRQASEELASMGEGR